MSSEPGTCDNCGSTGETRQAVHRVYLHPEPERLDEVEWWCAACASQYPHEAAATSGNAPA